MIIKLNNTSAPADMENTGDIRKETLESMKNYIPNLTDKMSGMVTELRTGIQEDSWEFLRMMVDGFNWVLEAYNALSDLLNPEEKIFSKAEMNDKIAAFGTAFRAKDAQATADALEETILPFLTKLQQQVLANL